MQSGKDLTDARQRYDVGLMERRSGRGGRRDGRDQGGDLKTQRHCVYGQHFFTTVLAIPRVLCIFFVSAEECILNRWGCIFHVALCFKEAPV
jgi:hypothetical protein